MTPLWMRAEARHPTSSHCSSRARHTLGAQCVLTELSCYQWPHSGHETVKEFMDVYHILSSVEQNQPTNQPTNQPNRA